MSIPQLRADINRLQAELSAAHSRIAELESKPETIREIKVPFEVVRVVYVDRPVEVVRYVDNPDLLETIEKLQAKVRGE